MYVFREISFTGYFLGEIIILVTCYSTFELVNHSVNGFAVLLHRYKNEMFHYGTNITFVRAEFSEISHICYSNHNLYEFFERLSYFEIANVV